MFQSLGVQKASYIICESTSVFCQQIGMSAVHWAVQKGHVDIVQLLMQHGANAAMPNKVWSMRLSL